MLSRFLLQFLSFHSKTKPLINYLTISLSIFFSGYFLFFFFGVGGVFKYMLTTVLGKRRDKKINENIHKIFLDFFLRGKSSNLWHLNKKMGGVNKCFSFKQKNIFPVSFLKSNYH